MKSKKNLLEGLKPLSFFNKGTISQLSRSYGLADSTVNTYISRYLKSKEIIQIKKGLYVSAEFFDKNKGDISYLFFLANILRTPSYISSWAALQYYDLTTEAIHIITSVTLKNTKAFETKAGNFSYQSIQKELFTGFSLEKGKFDFYIASPSKALFDLLYFKTREFRGVKLEDINKLVLELRIDIDEMNEEEREKFYSMVKKHIKS